MWIDIMTPQEALQNPREKIEREPMNCELRFIIWRAKDVPFKDEVKEKKQSPFLILKIAYE